MAKFITGLSEIANDYDGFILDIFGVVHNGIEPFPGTYHCLETLQKKGKRVCLLSNTPRRDYEVAGDLAAMGLPAKLYNGIVTAGDSSYCAIKDREGQKCWFAGTERFSALLDGIDMTVTETPDDADFILNAISGTYPLPEDQIHNELQKAKEKDLFMICANPDLVVNVGEHQYKCAGTYALYYEQIGGKVSYHGKPHAPVYEAAHKILGTHDKSKIIAVGDSLHTDVQGANVYGIDCVFNLDGIHREEITGRDTEIDKDKLISMIETQQHQPNFVLDGFQW